MAENRETAHARLRAFVPLGRDYAGKYGTQAVMGRSLTGNPGSIVK